MDTQSQHGDHQVAHLIDELEVHQDVLQSLRKSSSVAHQAYEKYNTIQNLEKKRAASVPGFITRIRPLIAR